jgi:hypothetical protein
LPAVEVNLDAAVLDGLDLIRDLDQFARGSFGISEGAIGGVFHPVISLVGWLKLRYFAGRCELLNSVAPGWAL